jgi:hypothetical protein
VLFLKTWNRDACAEAAIKANLSGNVQLCTDPGDSPMFATPADISSQPGAKLQSQNLVYDRNADNFSGEIATGCYSHGVLYGYRTQDWLFGFSPAKLNGSYATPGPDTQTVASDNNPDTMLAMFSDPAKLGSGYNARIDWGDLSSNGGSIVPFKQNGVQQYDQAGSPWYAVMGHHNYQEPGTYSGDIEVIRGTDGLDNIHILQAVTAATMTATTFKGTAGANPGAMNPVTSATFNTTNANAAICAYVKLSSGKLAVGEEVKFAPDTAKNNATGLKDIAINLTYGSATSTVDGKGFAETTLSWAAGDHGKTWVKVTDTDGHTLAQMLISIVP